MLGTMSDTPDLPAAQRLLDAALQRAERVGWDALHLHELAAELGLPLAELARLVADKHTLGQLLFDRADQALLACAERPGWRALSPVQRLEAALLAWLEPLAPHRRPVRQMLRYQLQPDHLHLQAQGLLRVSRTVQWWREASALPADGAQRELLEVALTATYLSTMACWLADGTPGGARTRRWLRWQLRLLPLPWRPAPAA
jgi:ubiquinone biosynthesis protein COQ9